MSITVAKVIFCLWQIINEFYIIFYSEKMQNLKILIFLKDQKHIFHIGLKQVYNYG
jgi:hypothetical protein